MFRKPVLVLLFLIPILALKPFTVIADTWNSDNLHVTTGIAFVIGTNQYFVNDTAPGISMDAAPYIDESSGRTLVPVRYLADALHATTNWNAGTHIAIVSKGSTTIGMIIGSTTLAVNGTAIAMDVAPVINNGRTYLPARWVAQSLGYDVYWDAPNKIAVVYPSSEFRVPLYDQAVKVSIGQQVKAVQQIGTVGDPDLRLEVNSGNDETECMNPADLPEIVWDARSQEYVNPQELVYRAVNPATVIAFLQQYNSGLADTADVDIVASAAQKCNINPLLLFAITGAEVSFDSETLYPSKWDEMHNNPFNVSMPGCGGAYYDTCGENTLQQTANEAAVTVATRLSSTVPPGENAIVWINDPSNPTGAGVYAGTNADPTTQWVTNTIGFFNELNSTSGIYSASEQQ